MGRRSKVHLEAANRRTIELALQRLSPKEIADQVGYSVYTVRQWIRESGAVPSTREFVLARVKEGLEIAEIARRARVSERRTREILQEVRGPSRKRRTPEENVERFLADPRANIGQRFTESRPFGRALVARCVEVTDDDPTAGLDVVKPSIELFERLRRTRAGEAGNLATCRLLQSRGIEAHAHMQLEDHRRAWSLLRQNFPLALDRCSSCEADYHRRMGLVMGVWAYSEDSRRRWSRATRLIDDAVELYTKLPDKGHDLLGNGLAHCYLNSANIRLYAEGPEPAAAEARKGLSLVDPFASTKLYRYLLHLLALTLKDSENPAEVLQARAIVERSLRFFSGKVSVPMVRTTWLAGMLAARCGDKSHALGYLSDALDFAVELKLPADVAAITADLGAVHPDPREIMAQIEGLRHGAVDDCQSRSWPKWLDGRLREPILALYSAAETGCSDRIHRIRRSAKALRETAKSIVADGGSLLPELVPSH